MKQRQTSEPAIPSSPLLYFKVVFSLLAAAAAVAELSLVEILSASSYDFVTPLTLILSYCLQVFLVLFGRRCGERSNGLIWLFWLTMVLCGVPQLKSSLSSTVYNDGPLEMTIAFLVQYIAAVLLLSLNSFADNPPNSHLLNKNKVYPFNYSSFLSQITFHWANGLVWLGWKRSLTHDDLWNIPAECATNLLDTSWRTSWSKELSIVRSKISSSKSEQGGGEREPSGPVRVSVTRVIIRSFFWSYIITAVLHVTSELLLFFTPRLLSLLISFTMSESEPVWHGYFYSILMLLVSLLTTVLRTIFAYKAWLIGIKIRSSLMSAVYSKALTLSSSARQNSTVGEIVNLMAVDSQRMSDFPLFSNLLWSGPLIILVALYELWQILGPSVLAGLVVLILLVPINSVIANKIKMLQGSHMKFKDKRIKLLNEIISGIKVLKLYAWEDSFNSQVEGVRRDEITVLRKSAFLHSFVTFIWLTTPYLVSLASFATYLLVSENNVLDAQMAFVSIALFNLMRFPITQLPQLIASGIQAKVSLSRMEKFLASSDIDPHAVSTSNKENEAIVVRGGQFSWGTEGRTDPWRLRDVDLEIGQGQLVAVVGPVGAGKSSLLSSLLGEINKEAGQVVVNGKVAYVSQQAWLQNATLKDNITWGQPLDERHYQKIIEACALQQDLDMLPAGDMTEIGEKGINLSGGQKQRISLARAAYNDADVILLDDPLSAVDSHVGRHIFDSLIGPNGMMKKKTRVLVTHAVWLLPQVDFLVVIRDGQIVEKGTWTQLLEGEGDFAHFLIQHITRENDDEEDGNELDQLCEQLENTRHGQVLMKQLSHQSNSFESGRIGGVRKCNRDSSCGSDQQLRESSGDVLSVTSNQRQQSISSSGVGSVHKRQRGESISMKDLKASKDNNVNEGKAGEILIQEEAVETGKVKWKVYSFYALAMGLLPAIVPALLYSVAQVFQAGSNVWLSYWTSNTTAPSTNTTQQDFNRVEFLAVYGAFGIGQSVLFYFGSVMLWIGCMRAGKDIHQRLLKRVLHLPMSFFDTNPSGRIMNRLSKDIDVLDSVLPLLISNSLILLAQVVATLIVIVVSTPLVAIVIGPIMVLYYFILIVYISTTRQLKRIESVTKSPVFSHFGESVQGVSTIRAFKKEKDFIRTSHMKIDYSVQAFVTNLACNRWLGVRLEVIGNLITFAAAVFAVAGRGSVSSGIVGLSITYALNVTVILNFLVRMSSEIEANIVSVERIKEYIEEKLESPWNVKEHSPSKSWPENGSLTFNNYQTRYRPGLELVLKGISCTINPGEKVGIVGRTGAGKSSLTLALFRIIEADGGTIEIDGINISKLGLHDLRSCLSIIPQDPVLFSGTLRTNLDPFDIYDDATIWHALELAHLSCYVRAQPLGLQSNVDEGGSNLSVGQQQLVSLARALLRKSRILVLDEATAAIDLETDDLIQATIRSKFADCTVLTIAHRLNTIMDCDRVMVMDKGNIAEFNTPATLVAKKDSIFYGMAKDAGLV
ncbi:multidrug resistance-associated protein 1-like isoform X2 [Homarus americanus]|nr:multidrug resistance-associated protein 1-like isoform X2 [Homarus americanus]